MISKDHSEENNNCEKSKSPCWAEKMENASQPVIIVNLNADVAWANRRACDFFGISLQDTSNVSFTTFLGTQSRCDFIQYCIAEGIYVFEQKIVIGDKIYCAEMVSFQLTHKDRIHVAVIMSKIKAKETHDIEASREYTQTLSKLAHDCNNMLGAVAGYADMIKLSNLNKDGLALDKVLEKRIKMILQASIRAADKIEMISRVIKSIPDQV